MHRRGTHLAVLTVALLALAVTSCASTPRVGPPTSRTTTTTPSPAVARVAVIPDQGVAGTLLVFRVEIRGPGTLIGEGVAFGDGEGSGANAGHVACGETARADHTSTYSHAYARPGTYQFADRVTVEAPPPSCAFEHTTARLSVIVASPLADAALGGAFLSPSQNIGCYIDEAPPGSLRCATFTPPRVVTMDASGTFQTCSGTECNVGNPAMETPALPYGSAIAGGAFQCLSARQGMTCTVVGHRGFELSRAGVTPVG